MVKFVRALLEERVSLLFRRLCTKRKEPAYTIENLKDRSTILVSGKNASRLLQKMLTNDITKLDSGNKSIFSLFLNEKGKVLHDAILYKFEDEYLIEVDNKALQPVKIHLKLHNDGRSVEIKNLEEKLGVWVVSGQGENELERLKQLVLGSEWICCLDPRLEDLGLRIVGPRKGDLINILKNMGLPVVRTQNLHQILRYKLGVAQGLSEIPFGRCIPTEINADFLSGMCTKKTSFIGCNTRYPSTFCRRVFPLEFLSDVEDSLLLNSPIQDQRGKKKSPIGYLCGLRKNFGLGLITVAEGLNNNQVRIISQKNNVFAHCSKPHWWPH